MRGIYSGYEGQGEQAGPFDRRAKISARHAIHRQRRRGQFPDDLSGWYAGRATHMHFKVLLDDRNVLTGQMYFPDAVNEFIYANIPAYAGPSAPRAVVNANDRSRFPRSEPAELLRDQGGA
jgi:protocatechuate 3,4-dioxygenase beta subunit